MNDTENLAPRKSRRASNGDRSGLELPLKILAAAVVLAGLHYLKELFLPLAFAWLITLLLTPLVGALERIRLPRGLAVLLVMVVSLSALGFAAWTLTSEIAEVASQLPTYRANIRSKIKFLRETEKGPLGRAAAGVKELGDEISRASATPPSRTQPKPVPVQIQSTQTTTFDFLKQISDSILAPVAMGILTIVFAIFMLMDREDLRNRLLGLSGRGNLLVVTRAVDDATRRVSRYLGMLFLVNLGFGTLVALGLWLIGLPNAPVWGALAGTLRLVPYIGTTIATVMPVALSFAVFDSWTQPVMVLGGLLVLEVITGHLVEPMLYGSHMGISSLALLMAAVFWTVLWGPAGLVLSTPLTVCMAVMGRHLPGLSSLHVLLGDQPTLTGEEHLYQRLLSGDQREARLAVEQAWPAAVEGDTQPELSALVEVFDKTVVPALRLVERDRLLGRLDGDQEEEIYLGLREIVEWVDQRAVVETEDPPSIVARGKALCFAAENQADEVGGLMAAAVMRRLGYTAEQVPEGVPLREVFASTTLEATDFLCISSLPPQSIAPARQMAVSLRRIVPGQRLIVGLWGTRIPADGLAGQLGSAKQTEVLASYSQLAERISRQA